MNENIFDEELADKFIAEKKRPPRGKSLERAIRKLFASYESRGIHCQQNHPEQLHDGTLVKKHGFDFQIFYNGKFYAFDAKECALTAWPLDKAKPHQLKALLDVEYNGGEGFFLVYFTKMKKLIKFSAKKVQNAIINKSHTLSPEDGESTTINLLRIK
jgi:penicillin-binding protein-related factor A (putative recombinase)